MRFLIKNIKKKQLNNIIYAIVQLFMLFFIYLIIDIQDKGVQIQFDLIIATIVYLFNFMINTDNFKEVDAFYWFIGLTYVFYFGQHIVYFLAGNSALPIFRNMLDVENIKVCDFYTIFGVSSLQLGYFISKFVSIEGFLCCAKYDKNITEISNSLVQRYAFRLIFVFIVPSFFYYFNKIKDTISLGYGATISNEAYTGGFLNILSGFMVPLFILLFLSIKKRYFNYIMLLMCYFAMVLFSGTRIQLISLGITLLYIAIRKGLIKTQGFIKIFRMIICIFIFGVGLNLLSYVRSGGNLLNILSYFEYFNENNVFYSMLTETGYTGFVNMVVISLSGNNVAFVSGLSYLTGIIYVIPNVLTVPLIGDFFFNTDMVFKSYITEYGGVGSSFVAESFFNFGWGGLLLLFILGYIFGNIISQMNKAIDNDDALNGFLPIYSFSMIIFFVRSDTVTFFRNYVWFGLTLYFLFRYLVSRKMNLSK